MTNERLWPNNQKHRRDRAAEGIADSLKKIDKLLARVECGDFTRHGLQIDLLTIKDRLNTALRHLEKAGAQTEPD